jgi:hypothetical protein
MWAAMLLEVAFTQYGGAEKWSRLSALNPPKQAVNLEVQQTQSTS